VENQRSLNLRTLLVGAVGVIGGLALIILAEHSSRAVHPLLRGFLEATAISLLTGSLLGLGYEFLLRKELMRHFDESVTALKDQVEKIREDVDQRMHLSKNIDVLGMIEICPRENHYDYSDFFIDSKKLFFVFNDGRTWFSNHEHDLNARAELPGKETHIILINPKSTFVDALSSKVSQTPDELRKKIDETTRMVSRLRWRSHKVQVYGHSVPTSYSLVMSETKAVFIPYQMARKSDKLPCFIFSAATADGFYASLWRDVQAILDHSGTERLYPPVLV
jgi:hypothetical protein